MLFVQNQVTVINVNWIFKVDPLLVRAITRFRAHFYTLLSSRLDGAHGCSRSSIFHSALLVGYGEEVVYPGKPHSSLHRDNYREHLFLQAPLCFLLLANIVSMVAVTAYVFTLNQAKIILNPPKHLPVRRPMPYDLCSHTDHLPNSVLLYVSFFGCKMHVIQPVYAAVILFYVFSVSLDLSVTGISAFHIYLRWI